MSRPALALCGLEARDVVTAGLWVLAVVPQAFGFWLVTGDVLGVADADQKTLVLAALLGLGVATIVQVVAGYRMVLYEGPSAAYLAAVVVVSTAGDHGIAAVTGGLIAAGVFTVAVGLLGLDRLLRPLMSPIIALLFVLVLTIAVVPATVERAIGSTADHAAGTAAAWISSLAVVATAFVLQRLRVRPYALLGALLAGTAVHAIVAGPPGAHIGGGLAVPDLLPWGAPELSVAVVAPFIVAALLAALNTIAAIEVMAAAHGAPPDKGRGRRGLVAHGGSLAAGAVGGNLLGTVARLDSVPIVDLLGNRRRRALALAALMVIALAFVEPFLALVAALPLSVSAALLAFILCSLIVSASRGVWRMGRRAWIIVLPALIPSIAWTPLQGSLSATATLLANPMLWGLAVGVGLERLLAMRQPAAQEPKGRP